MATPLTCTISSLHGFIAASARNVSPYFHVRKSSRNNKIRNKSSKKFDGQTSSVSIDHSSLDSYGWPILSRNCNDDYQYHWSATVHPQNWKWRKKSVMTHCQCREIFAMHTARPLQQNASDVLCSQEEICILRFKEAHRLIRLQSKWMQNARLKFDRLSQKSFTH